MKEFGVFLPVATRSTRQHEDVSGDLQGVLRGYAACPGWDASAPKNE